MAVKLYVWRGRDAWLAQCPTLEIGSTGATRDLAMRELRRQADPDARKLFGDGIEAVEGPPPPMMMENDE